MKQHSAHGHIPVLLKEVLEVLSPKDNATYIDATFGAGGYTKGILSSANCSVIGIDQDQNTLQYAEEIQQTFKDRFIFKHSNFRYIKQVLSEFNLQVADGVVFDCGVSSMQLDTPERGFSFMGEGDLDMRMDQSQNLTAADIVNNYPQDELADLIYNLGGERHSRKIAKAIVQAREKSPITQTLELAKIIKGSVGFYKDDINPATRTFQALRIRVNEELEALKEGVESAIQILAPGGVIATVSFHSLEDKIVKDIFKKLTKREKINKYRQVKANKPLFELVNKDVIVPTIKEIRDNPRARSAKLRALRRLS